MKILIFMVLMFLAGTTTGYGIKGLMEKVNCTEEVKDLKDIIETRMYNDNLSMFIKEMMKGQDFNGCCGCHESREIFEKSYKKLSNIPCKSEPSTMQVHVCEGTCSEEEEGYGTSKQEDRKLGTTKVLGEFKAR